MRGGAVSVWEMSWRLNSHQCGKLYLAHTFTFVHATLCPFLYGYSDCQHFQLDEVSQVTNAMWKHWPWYLSLGRLWRVAFKGVGSLRHQARGKSPLTTNALNVGKGAGQKSPNFLWSPILGLEVLARQRRRPCVACFILSLVEGTAC